MNLRNCISCKEDMPEKAFRANSKGECTWCQWSDAEKRAKARYKDKVQADKKRPEDDKRLNITEENFIAWYLSQTDCCHYCGITMKDVKELRLKRSHWGYYVSWDIDRKDSLKPYEEGNMALSCFMCNMAKAKYFSAEETKILGSAIGEIIQARLAEKRS